MSAKRKTTFECWQNFLACVALHMLLPLLPLLLERWFSGAIASKSASLTAALYSLAIALSSRHVALLGVGILFGFAFAATFGYLSTDLYRCLPTLTVLLVRLLRLCLERISLNDIIVMCVMRMNFLCSSRANKGDSHACH
ncbi:hypothetical protein [Duganella radicis]|uniref:Uncharacterized protein n=1 Tax=Duganella radicis TaxID=551988 RepID=A0A6L6PQQ7_9BURK|nr:hypothetical protein [Duganella radicis]MTV41363.1 hypothetical protein [Duganella radicis]